MKNKINHTIWNSEINIEDWKDFLDQEEDERGESISDEEKFELAYNLNQEYLDEERLNLNVETKGTIVAIADLGFWNGRIGGYKLFADNISNIFITECDIAHWFVDSKDLKFVGSHHDGTHYITYREMKNENKVEEFCELIYSGKITDEIIKKYTKSLRPYVKNVYGF